VNDGIQTPALAAVLEYTDAMTTNVTVPDGVFAELKKYFNEREVVEITATIGAYNCVSRFLVALDVGERNGQEGPKEGGKE
jgi:alkylhydroperoxidase family enzyme